MENPNYAENRGFQVVKTVSWVFSAERRWGWGFGAWRVWHADPQACRAAFSSDYAFSMNICSFHASKGVLMRVFMQSVPRNYPSLSLCLMFHATDRSERLRPCSSPYRSGPSLVNPYCALTTATTQKMQPNSTDRHRSEEHTSELQSHYSISYAVFCLKKIFLMIRRPPRSTL